jgi:pimeloyl-ACP methyl ester carboxylesterase
MPQLNCFPDTFTRLVWSLADDAEGLIGAVGTSFDQRWSRYVSRSKTCMSVIQEQGDDSIAYYMGRRSVVDDIVAIAENHGQWREAEVKRLLLDPKVPTMGLTRAHVIASTKWRRGKEPILFWGTSYGTVLGSTLAAMYPERIKRMILDSVLSPTYSIFGQTDNNLVHADGIFAKFVQLCHKSGPERCQVHRDSEDEIFQVVSQVTSDLANSPLAVGATMGRGPDVITSADIKRLIGRSLYKPHLDFPFLARIFQDLAQGNGSSFADYKATVKSVSVLDFLTGRYDASPRCKADGPYSPACSRPNEWLMEGLLGVTCGDGNAPGNTTKDDFRSYWYRMRNQSSALGDAWSEWSMMCMGWDTQTKWAFDGQFRQLQSSIGLD